LSEPTAHEPALYLGQERGGKRFELRRGFHCFPENVPPDAKTQAQRDALAAAYCTLTAAASLTGMAFQGQLARREQH